MYEVETPEKKDGWARITQIAEDPYVQFVVGKLVETEHGAVIEHNIKSSKEWREEARMHADEKYGNVEDSLEWWYIVNTAAEIYRDSKSEVESIINAQA